MHFQRGLGAQFQGDCFTTILACCMHLCLMPLVYRILHTVLGLQAQVYEFSVRGSELIGEWPFRGSR